MGGLHGLYVIDPDKSSWHELVVYGAKLLVLIDYDVAACRRVVRSVQKASPNDPFKLVHWLASGVYALSKSASCLHGFEELLVYIPEELFVIEEQIAFDAALTAYQESL